MAFWISDYNNEVCVFARVAAFGVRACVRASENDGIGPIHTLLTLAFVIFVSNILDC